MRELPHAIPYQWLPGDRILFYDTSDELAVASPDLVTIIQLTHTSLAPPWSGIEIRDTKSGKIRSRFAVDGIVDETTELALDARHIALLNPTSSDRLEIRTRAGQLQRTTFASDATDLSISGRWAVYLAQGRVRALDITTGSTRTLATAKGTVVGLSIEGTRVAWGEQRRGTDVILALNIR